MLNLQENLEYTGSLSGLTHILFKLEALTANSILKFK